MKKLSLLINELQNIDLDQSENVPVYEDLLAEVVSLKNPDSIVPLMGLFYDGAIYPEVMYSVVHAIEIFDDSVYVREVLRGAPALCSRCPYWASTIFVRILNSEPTRLELAQQLRNAGNEIKSSVRSLMETLGDSDVQFLPKTLLIIIAAS